MKKLLLALLLLVWSSNLAAIDKNPLTQEAFSSPSEAKRYTELLHELRCMVCPNQPLSDSNAELAQDLREEVRSLVLTGKTNREVKDFLVARYGDMVLYKPDFKPKNYLLWLAPAILLLIAFVVLVFFIRKQKQATNTTTDISATEREKLQNILGDKH